MTVNADEPIVASIIIPAWRLATELQNCLTSISESTDAPNYEVIVVVNGASPKVVEVAQNHPAATTVIPLAANIGFGMACNIGAKTARGKYLIFLNDDTTVRPDWLSNIVRSAQEHNAAAVGSLLLSETGEILEAGARVLRVGEMLPLGQSMTITEAETDQPGLLEPRQVEYASGAALLVDADIFELMGGFDPEFAPAYYEDTDLQFRLRAAGYQVWFEPTAQVVHITNGSTRDLSFFRDFAGVHQSKAAFERRWGPYIDRSRTNPNLPLDDLLNLPLVTIKVNGLDDVRSDDESVLRVANQIQQKYNAWLERQLEDRVSEHEHDLDRMEMLED